MIRVDIDTVTAIISEVADAVIMPRFRNLKIGEIAYKIGDDPVTIADKEAEIALSTRLLDLLPGSKVLGEEGFAVNREVLTHLFSESPIWIIDPIDGTRNFVNGSPKFGVIIALAERNQTIAGWIYDPTSKEAITTEKGSGAWFKGQKLKVLPPAKLSEMRGVLSPRILEPGQKHSSFNKLGPNFEVMTAGAHEYPLLLINGPHFGKNLPQIHYRSSLVQTTPWDDAAGILMHQEAGGYSSQWDGQPYKMGVMNKGQLLTPDRDSWQEFKAWCQAFCTLP